MTKDASRTLTREELNRQGKILAEVREILIENGIKPVLSDGIVLGYVREGDFIKWDFDADFFVDKGFTLITMRNGKTDWKVAVKKEDYHIDIRSFYRDGLNRVRKVRRRNGKYSVYTMPSEFMDNLQEIEFYGEKYFIPKDTEGYLTCLYGDWRKVIRSVRHDEYLNPNFKKATRR
jgi:phosphorylcholine metabolism protein LicD